MDKEKEFFKTDFGGENVTYDGRMYYHKILYFITMNLYENFLYSRAELWLKFLRIYLLHVTPYITIANSDSIKSLLNDIEQKMILKEVDKSQACAILLNIHDKINQASKNIHLSTYNNNADIDFLKDSDL